MSDETASQVEIKLGKLDHDLLANTVLIERPAVSDKKFSS
jgi:hypothetical protein